jgi:hypothetical protein
MDLIINLIMDFLDLIEVIHHQWDKKSIQVLAAKPGAINRADKYGNTPLHYAVASHDLEVIELLITQGASITAKNRLGETGADWFQEYITSAYSSKPPKVAELKQQIQKNNLQFVANYLKGGASPALRFSEGETLLHLAVKKYRKTLIELILEGRNNQEIRKLLHLEDRYGMNPINLVLWFNPQVHLTEGTEGIGEEANKRLLELYSTSRLPLYCFHLQDLVEGQNGQTALVVGYEIHHYLQEKKEAAEQENVELEELEALAECYILRGRRWDLKSIAEQEMKALADSFAHSRTPADFEQLNPLRPALVKLAYNICTQAESNLASMLPESLVGFPLVEPLQITAKLLLRLFGDWSRGTKWRFHKKLHSVTNYLAQLIQQQQADQIIHFSSERVHCINWHDSGNNRIFLNPMLITDEVDLVEALIREVTYQVNRSYAFFHPDSLIKKQAFSIDLNDAYQLASTGAAEAVRPEQRKLIEIRQLLEEGFSDRWQQNSYRWMALNGTETLAKATLALAALPRGAAQFKLGSRQTILQFQQPKSGRGANLFFLFQVPEPWNWQLEASEESSAECELPSLTTLPQAIASQRSLSETDGQPGAATTQSVISLLSLLLESSAERNRLQWS